MHLTAQTDIIIYGAGYCGAMLAELLQTNQIQPLCIFDKDKQKQAKKLFSIEIAEPQFRQADIIIVALLAQGHLYASIKSYLLELGYFEEQIVHIYELENQRELFDKQKLVIKPNPSVAESYANQLEQLELVLSDEESRRILSAAKQFLEGDPTAKFPAHPIEEQYFAYDIYKKIGDEEVIECGGFKGDVMRIFLENNRGRFSHYTIIEPDERYLVFIEANAAGYCRDNIKILNYALSDRSQELYVTNYMDMNSVVSENKTIYSTQKVQAKALDELLPDTKCTFLKIDVEGYELKMLQGAKKIIEFHKPVIAVAAYHHECDLYEITKKLLEYNPEYKLFLRSYMNYQEMVLYAVPRERIQR